MNRYSGEYFNQRSSSRSDYVQALRASLFSDISGGTILDFGCGNGGIISRLTADRKLGVEIGEEAAQVARSSGIEVYPSVADIPQNTADIAISFHALEHVDDDAASMLGIFRALRPGGRVRIIVPGELPIRKQRHWFENPNMHLRTWTPLSLGNLADRAGFTCIQTRIEPMPSGSRGARLFGKPYRYYIALRDNAFNVILDATKHQAAP